MGDAGDVRHTRVSGKAVSKGIHRETAGNRGAVVDITSLI